MSFSNQTKKKEEKKEKKDSIQVLIVLHAAEVVILRA